MLIFINHLEKMLSRWLFPGCLVSRRTAEGICLSKVEVLVAHDSNTTVSSWKIFID